MRNIDLKGSTDSYREHYDKAINALGDPTKCEDINGWIRRLKELAENIYNDSVTVMDAGGRVTDLKSGRDLSKQDVLDRFGARMNIIIQLNEKNHEIAKQNRIILDDVLNP